jgi:hypothetical protein
MISWIFLLFKQRCALLLQLDHATDTDRQAVLSDIAVNVIRILMGFVNTEPALLSYYEFLEA